MISEHNSLISFSLYGTDPMYSDGAIYCAETMGNFYPGWKARFYVSSSVDNTVIEKLKENGAEIIIVNHSGDELEGSFWRFLPISDSQYQYVIIRDTDSRFTEREVAAVDHWIQSGKTLHVIRDHPNHQSVVMGGLWGIRGGRFKNIEKIIKQWRRNCAWSFAKIHKLYGADQVFLSEVIYNAFKEDVLVHSEHVGYPDEKPVPIPHERQDNEFLGQRVPEDPVVYKKQMALLDQHDGSLKTYPFPTRGGFWTNVKNKVISGLSPLTKN
ncbi:hypothetical protein N9X40_00610 [bacterium]|nr:hypothetical protein [bacterium]